MHIAIALLKLNFAGWLRTNASKKGFSLIVLLIKFKLLQNPFYTLANLIATPLQIHCKMIRNGFAVKSQ